MNYGNVGICRSADHPTSVLHPFSRKKGCHHREAAVFSLLQRRWGWLGLSHTGAVMGLCVLPNCVQPGAGSWFYQHRQSQPPTISCCSEARLLPVKGPACSHPSSTCQAMPGSGKELKWPDGPLLFNNFGAFHSPPYHATNSCAWALAAARAHAWELRFCARHCPAMTDCPCFMGTLARGDQTLSCRYKGEDPCLGSALSTSYAFSSWAVAIRKGCFPCAAEPSLFL